jgi:hypothetical protein
LAAAALLLAVWPGAAKAQVGPRTFSNSNTRGLDAGTIGDQLGISSSDATTKKMELIRDIQYWEPDRWQGTSVTWVRFERRDDGSVVVSEEGVGVIGGMEAGKLEVEQVEDGAWRLSPRKAGKLDLYFDTTFEGEPFTVWAGVPTFDGEAYGAIYRGRDFLFFVVQRKHPPAGA